MRHFLVPVVLVLALILGAGCASVPNISFPPALPGMVGGPSNGIMNEVTAPSPTEVSAVVAKCGPSVVAVDTDQMTGSGWILDNNGLIVTNNHVIEGASTATVTLQNGQTYTSRTILTDAVDDLAVIDIGVSGLPAATIGDSSKVTVGDWVVAMGNAQGEGICATQGAICGTDSTFSLGTQETLYNTLETTAPITYGNSGGPLFNMNGEVVGIVTAAQLTQAGTQVAGYAISSNAAQQIIRDLIRTGCVTRGWVGVSVSSVTDLSTTGWKLPVEKGAVVIRVVAGSPASQAGLEAGDIIVNFGGRDISTADDLVKAVRAAEIGQPVKITYWRDQNENTITANPVQDPAH